MVFTCSISGERCEMPVVSPISGRVFEKRVIVKYIKDQGCDPINQESLSEDQLIELKEAEDVGPPRSVGQTSIPSLLKMLQDEFDMYALNNFTLRQKLTTARQELSDTLYQHDGATRVIARLMKELAAAREALSTLKPHSAIQEVSTKAVDVEMEESQGMSDAVKEKLDQKAKVLTAARKARGKKLPDSLTKPEDIKSFEQKVCHTALHSTGVPGITALDLKDQLVATGGADKNVVLFDLEKEQEVTSWKGHSKKISSVILHPNKKTVISAAYDAQVRIWSVGEEGSRVTIDCHSAPVTDVSLHPTNDYILSVSHDASWAFSDINTGRAICVHRPRDSEGSKPINCGQLHPDGLIFGTGGDDNIVKIWDLRQQVNAANFPGHEGAIKCMAFSEIGFHLATGSDDGTVKLWDLRKLEMLRCSTEIIDGKAPVSCLSFDQFGAFLCVGSSDVKMIHVKPWAVVGEWANHTSTVTGVRIQADATGVVSVGMDKSLRVYSA
ncbi:unnamed protein product, partial [Mesorhabditis belari]|uniref:Pre-mRNA-processing factor 19 n=1 Tax=Mesorhabditis belari TaxID=2138241 RepID=A0AAF3F6W1_9BILA